MHDTAAVSDPTTEAYWKACSEHRLIVQRCKSCGHHQFYPRPFCLACQGEVEWVEASGKATIYSLTTIRLPVLPELPPPYLVAVVELAEGPRLLTNIEGTDAKIGQAVTVAWRHRDPLPPLPVFTVAA
jgi:uncharacterized OB-fold protein